MKISDLPHYVLYSFKSSSTEFLKTSDITVIKKFIKTEYDEDLEGLYIGMKIKINGGSILTVDDISIGNIFDYVGTFNFGLLPDNLVGEKNNFLITIDITLAMES